MLIGGGSTPPEAMQRFISLAGGPDAPILILAFSSEDADAAGKRSVDFWKENGARNVQHGVENLPALIEKSKGIYLPGGDQNRFFERFSDQSPVADAMRKALAKGAVVGGTSAGCSLMGEMMPTGAAPAPFKKGGAPVSKGLGLLPGIIADQHFLARDRLMRLITAVIERPNLTGIGIEERSWAVVTGRQLEVGGGQAIVVKALAKPRTKGDLLGCDRVELKALYEGDRVRL